MRRACVIVVCILLGARFSSADDKTTDDCTAPDFEHKIVLHRSQEGAPEYLLEIRKTGTEDKVIYSRPAGGYASFEAATNPVNFQCLWSPDSKFAAVFERGTKRTGDTSIYLVRGDSVSEIPLPDVTPRIERHLTTGMRALWIRPQVWLPGYRLILTVEGTQLDEEHGNFRFLLTVRLWADTDGKFKAKILSFEQDRSVPFSIR